MVTMNGMEPLQRLFLRANEMVQEVSDSFEQHFLWLEEVVAEARQTLASPELVLLPKTPSAAPSRTHRLLKEDTENLPPPASSQPARRGRLCSKLAFEKIQEQGRMSKVKKLRRPSSPITQAPPSTTHKSALKVFPSFSRSVEDPGESPEPKREHAIPSSPSSHGSCPQSMKLMLKARDPSTPQKDTSSPKKYHSSLQKDNNPSQEDTVSTQKDNRLLQNDDFISQVRSVTFQHKEDTISQKNGICQDHSSSQANSSSPPMEVTSPHSKSFSKEVVSESPDSSTPLKSSVTFQSINNEKQTAEKAIQEGDSGDSSQNTTKATVVSQVLPQEEEEFHLQLDESYDECVPVEHPEEDQDIELVCELPEMQKLKKAITQSNPLGPEISNSEQMKEDLAPPNSLPQPPSIPTQSIRCTDQEVVEVQDVSLPSGTQAPSCFAPAPRITRTKQRAMEALDAPPSSDSLPQSPSVPAPRVTRTKQKATKVQDAPLLSDSLPQLPPAPTTRITRTKQKAIEAQDVLLPPESIPQPPSAPVPRVTRTKQKAIEKEVPPSSPSLPQPAPRITYTKQKAKEMEPSLSPQETLGRKLGIEDKEEETKSREAQAKLMHQQHLQESNDKVLKGSDVKDSGVFSLGVKADGWDSAESVSSGELCAPPTQPSTPPMRVTRSKMSKLQRPQHSPEKALPATQNLQQACCSPRGAVLPQSPCKVSPATRKFAVQLDRDGGLDHLASEVIHSPVRVVRHSPDKTGKVVQARLPVVSGSSGRITPGIISRMQPFLTSTSTSSSSSSTEHRRIIKRTAGTPSEGRRHANIVIGITSFVKSQPARPTREEIEELRIQELQKKKEHEEETLKKKEQLLWAKTEERKRCNEERMRRAKETRLKKEQLAAATKEQQKRERQQREARQREEEEQQRRLRQQQLAKKKAEEEAKKAAKLKEEEEKKKQEEEEKRRKKLEEEKRRQKLEEESRKKLEEERRNYLAEQRIVLEEQRKLKMAKAHKLMKEKEEAEHLRQKESLRILREKELQIKREQEAKAVMSSTYIYKNTYTTPASTISTNETSSGPLNTTYTKSGGATETSVRADNYEMTPVQPKRASSSLNYNIDDLQSDDSTDDDASPKKKIPQWAMKTQMRAALLQQEHFPPKMDNIFPPSTLLVLPDLSQIFPKQKRRFRKRTSSAIWETPPSKFFRVTSPM